MKFIDNAAFADAGMADFRGFPRAGRDARCHWKFM